MFIAQSSSDVLSLKFFICFFHELFVGVVHEADVTGICFRPKQLWEFIMKLPRMLSEALRVMTLECDTWKDRAPPLFIASTTRRVLADPSSKVLADNLFPTWKHFSIQSKITFLFYSPIDVALDDIINSRLRGVRLILNGNCGFWSTSTLTPFLTPAKSFQFKKQFTLQRAFSTYFFARKLQFKTH